MKANLLSLLAISTMPLSAVTFVIGDGFNLNGTGSFGSDPLENPFSSPGSAGRDNSIVSAELSTLVNLSGGGLDAFGTLGDGFDPFVVGQLDFGSDIFRSGSLFDLSNIAPAPAGFVYQISSIEFFIEVSGATFNNGVNNAGDNVNVGVFANLGIGSAAITRAPDATITLNNSDSGTVNFDAGNTPFLSVTLANDLINLGSDSSFEIVLDAGNNPTTAAVFGSSLAPGVGITGTGNVEVAPVLRITADLVAVPEPSSAVLFAVASLGLLLRRRRVLN